MLNFQIIDSAKTVSCCTPAKLFTPTLTKLLFLEKQQEYVFHGSPFKLARLEPIQALDYRNGAPVKDGPPAVFASHSVQYAIFMALINHVNCRTSVLSRCKFKNGEAHFAASQNALAQLDSTTIGYVHVLNRSYFVQRLDNEWVRYRPVNPVVAIAVRLSDFHGEIEILG